jgi:hypothetical protein
MRANLINLTDLTNLTGWKSAPFQDQRTSMAQTREKPAVLPSKRKRRRRRGMLGSASSGEFTVLKIGEYEIELPVPGAKFRKIGKGKNGHDVGKLLAGYAAVAEKAARAGRAVEYTVRVTPDGDAEPVVEADELDANLEPARRRGQDKAANILKGDDMLTARDFGSLIGASHETVNVRRQRGEILGLQGATRVVRYPSWQVTDEGTLVPGLARLSEVLGGQPWTVYRFLRTPHAELGGRTALDVLKAGRQEDVLNVARNQTNGAFT